MLLTCRYGNGQQGATEHNPTLEETVESLFKRLREKRQNLGLPENMKVCLSLKVSYMFNIPPACRDLFYLQVLYFVCEQEMTQAQMVLEKITLQKCLLYFESLHGRPVRFTEET